MVSPKIVNDMAERIMADLRLEAGGDEAAMRELWFAIRQQVDPKMYATVMR